MIVAYSGIRDIDASMADTVEMAVLEDFGAGAKEMHFGGARGADTFALLAAAALPVRRVVYVPFTVADQPPDAQIVIRRYATKVVEMGLPRSNRGAFHQRNRLMTRDAERLTAFTDGRGTGGTAYTVQHCLDQGVEVAIVPVTTEHSLAEPRTNPELTGLHFDAPLFALTQYKSASDGQHTLSDVVRRNKMGRATKPEIERVTRQLLDFIDATPDLRMATTIATVPRRVPDAPSSMYEIARGIAHARKLRLEEIVRVAEPIGGQVAANRLRFAADEHARTMKYAGSAGQLVIVLDDVVTSSGTMNGAFRAVKAAGATPVGLAVLFSDALGVRAV